MTPLRQRMLEDMQIRNLTENSQGSYVRHVACFARHFGRSPAKLGVDDIRAYQLYLTQEKGLAASSITVAVLGRAVDASGQPNQCGDLHRSRCQVPVVEGAETEIEIRESPNDDDDVGRVVHHVNQTQRILVNETLPGHVFHPGTVTRQVVVDSSGNVKVTTVGEGTGEFPTLNEIGGPLIFLGVDLQIKGRF